MDPLNNALQDYSTAQRSQTKVESQLSEIDEKASQLSPLIFPFSTNHESFINRDKMTQLSRLGATENLLIISENIVHARQAGTYFTFEKVTDENRQKYSNIIAQEFPADAAEKREMLLLQERAVLGVLASLLKVVKSPIDNTDIWFAYTQQQENGPKEMCISFLTQKGDHPLASTMGLLRLPSFIQSGLPKTHHLALRFLGFIAEAISHLYPEKRYFYTAPTDDMLSIFHKALSEDAFWSKRISTLLLQQKSSKALKYIKSAPFIISQKPTFTIKVSTNDVSYNVPDYLRIHADIFDANHQVILLWSKLREQFR